MLNYWKYLNIPCLKFKKKCNLKSEHTRETICAGGSAACFSLKVSHVLWILNAWTRNRSQRMETAALTAVHLRNPAAPSTSSVLPTVINTRAHIKHEKSTTRHLIIKEKNKIFKQTKCLTETVQWGKYCTSGLISETQSWRSAMRNHPVFFLSFFLSFFHTPCDECTALTEGRSVLLPLQSTVCSTTFCNSVLSFLWDVSIRLACCENFLF